MKSQKELLKEIERYKSLSVHDTLTGLYNRRKLEIDLARYLELKKRHNIHFLVLMLDIDKFKKINDLFGHKAGDSALKKVAKILKQCVRGGDKCYRLSGDEFVLILSHCNKDKTSPRIKELLKQEDIEASIGKNKLCKNILEIIDRKMYEEKRRK